MLNWIKWFLALTMLFALMLMIVFQEEKDKDLNEYDDEDTVNSDN